MRFSRRRQRERAEQAAEEADRDATVLYWVARLLPGPTVVPPPVPNTDEIEPYRGFRVGRGRARPDRTGYGEPTSPDREQWTEPRADDPTLDPVLGDEDDEPWTPR